MDEQRMLHTDAFAWYMEDDPALRSTVVAIARLEGEPDWGELRERIDCLTRLVPRLRMRVQAPWRWLGAPRWTVQERFDLDYHLRRARVPDDGTWADVLQFARTAAMSDFDRSRPLWEFTLLTGLPDGGSAFVSKLHHSLSDGIGGVQLMTLVVDTAPDRRSIPPDAPVPDGHRLSRAGLVTRVVADEVTEFVGGLAGLVRELPGQAYRDLRNPWGGAQARLSTLRSVYRFVAPVGSNARGTTRERDSARLLATLDIPFDGLHEAASSAGCHLNDAYLAGLTEGIRRYHAECGEQVDELAVTMPISQRRAGDPTGGNRITLVRFSIAASIDDAQERMRHIASLVHQWRHEPAMAHTQQIAHGLTLLPRAYLGTILKRMELVASDVPGVPEPVWLAGSRVTGYYGFGPTIGAALNVTLMSYAGTCNIGINLDTAAITMPEKLIDCLEAGFADVMAVAAQV